MLLSPRHTHVLLSVNRSHHRQADKTGTHNPWKSHRATLLNSSGPFNSKHKERWRLSLWRDSLCDGFRQTRCDPFQNRSPSPRQPWLKLPLKDLSFSPLKMSIKGKLVVLGKARVCRGYIRALGAVLHNTMCTHLLWWTYDEKGTFFTNILTMTDNWCCSVQSWFISVFHYLTAFQRETKEKCSIFQHTCFLQYIQYYTYFNRLNTVLFVHFLL